MRVLIIGCGPSGLLLAILLAEHHEVLMVEKEATVESFDPNKSYTIDITGKGMLALNSVSGLLDTFREKLLAFRGIRVLFRKDEPFDDVLGPGVTGSRGEICALLLEEAKKSKRVSILFSTTADVVDAEAGIVRINSSGSEESFDLVVGADGAGSRTRETLGIKMSSSGQHPNFSTMVQMNRNLDQLDPSFLHVLGLPPVFLVAGAIDKKKVSWFCQIGTNTAIPNFDWILKNCHGLLPFISPETKQNIISIPSGRWKLFETFVKVFIALFFPHLVFVCVCVFLKNKTKGKCVLIGDAACPFIPVGQGLNAGLLSAATLSKCLESSPSISEGLKRYEQQWKPEANAASAISRSLDLGSGFWILRGVRLFVYSLVGCAAVQNAKSSQITYQKALRMERNADIVLAIASIAAGLFAIKKMFY